MKLVIYGTLAALASVAYSQQGTLPVCAQSCVKQFTSGSNIGSCGNLDIHCICSSSSFLSSIACCLAAACDASDQQAAVTYAKQICTTAGVNVPDAVSCVSSSTAAPATSAASPVASSGVAPAGSSVGSTTATSDTSSTNAVSASTAPSSTPTSASPSASATKNTGVQNAAAAGMSFMGGLAAILALI